MKIINYPFYKFIQQDEGTIKEYMVYLTAVKPIAHFKRGLFRRKIHGVKQSLTELTFGQVNKVKRLIGNPSFENITEVVMLVYQLNQQQVLRMPIFKFYGCLNFITKEVKNIHQMEKTHYKIESDEYDSIIEEAGIEQMQQFGDLPVIDQIAKGKPWDYDKVESENYLTIHAMLWMQATRENIRIRMNKLQSR